jgi:hypothetical protein
LPKPGLIFPRQTSAEGNLIVLPRNPRPRTRLPGVIAAIALTAVAVRVAPRAPKALAYAGAHPSLLAAAASITALAVTLAASLALAVRGS